MIDYKNDLNPAQYEAATTLEGPILVIAGAGSGKTRTIVYRLAHLVQSGVPASSILLLTFTRKAAQEMLMRANQLLQTGSASSAHAPLGRSSLSLDISAIQGGTFHSFAFSILRLFQPHGYSQSRLTVMDSSDMTSAMSHCRTELRVGKGDRSFPKNQTLLSLLSKSRNKEVSLDILLHNEAQHLLPHLEDMETLGAAYSLFKKEKNLLDYDDLLFVLEETLRTNAAALDYCRSRFRYIMVDEYQDTNPVQARIAALIAGGDLADPTNIQNTVQAHALTAPAHTSEPQADLSQKQEPQGQASIETATISKTQTGASPLGTSPLETSSQSSRAPHPPANKQSVLAKKKESSEALSHAPFPLTDVPLPSALSASGGLGISGTSASAGNSASVGGSGSSGPSSPPPGNIMVVGDDAQSIYAFRGADVNNILRFPDSFPGTKLIKLEENYRSTQPILDLANAVLKNATHGYEKNLFTNREGGLKPNVVRPLTDKSQASIIVSRIAELRHTYPANEIAVLFRSGFHSYNVELQLNKLGVRFRKYGGIRYAEAAHIKDIMSFARLVLNPLDFTAFARVASFCKGVGPKTTLKIYQQLTTGDEKIATALKKHSQLGEDLAFVNVLQQSNKYPSALLSAIVDHYQPRLANIYPDDHPRRLQDLEQLVVIASAYEDLDLLIADLSLEEPLQEEELRDTIVLSTIHSAKGLEWDAVIILDLVEERFPSRKSMVRENDFEEERRLMYVACTRARKHLDLFVPATMYDRGSGGSMPTIPSPFVRELPDNCFTEWYENYTGGLSCQSSRQQTTRRQGALSPQRPLTPPAGSTGPTTLGDLTDCDDFSENNETPSRQPYSLPPSVNKRGEDLLPEPENPKTRPEDCGYCRHRLFGRGKIVQHLSPDKYRVNFPGFGLKVIMAAYLTLEDD